MTVPQAYPRVPHLVPGRGSRDDTVVDAAAAAALLGSEVVVEEKLDGANVSLWVDDDARLAVALRGGVDSLDRAGQRGPLRAWVAAHADGLFRALSGYRILYGEWLLLTHTVSYDRMPAYLVALDLRSEGGFASVDERNAMCAEAGIETPPQLWRGIPGDLPVLERFLGRSAWSDSPAEGLVVRRADGGEPRLAKLVRPGFHPISDRAWDSGRPHNGLRAGEVSWH